MHLSQKAQELKTAKILHTTPVMKQIQEEWKKGHVPRKYSDKSGLNLRGL
jgi:hypothetical protein